MQEEEGFACQSQTEFEQLAYIPTFTATKYKPKMYSHPLKLLTISPIYDSSVFINPDLKKELDERFHSRHRSNIVYPLYKQFGNANRKGLEFNSSYQGGNLEYAISEDYKNYSLYIRPDTNTSTHFQWFCFKVKNKNIKCANFVLKNFAKKNMLYRSGLRPYYRSAKAQGGSYQQLQTEVRYQENSGSEDQQYYELHFSFEFNFDNDQVEFCSQPSYSLQRCQKLFKFSPFHKTTLSKTVLGHPINGYILNELQNSKAVVVVFARQHPGESVGSWLIQGFANKLVDIDSSNIYWILVPMINIDGVVMGNNRTGMLGYDFNRHWYIDQETHRGELFPEIMGIMRYFKKRRKEFAKKVKIFIDFHGHSSEQNVFAYGPPHHKNSELHELSRLLPFMMSKKNENFSLPQSNYEISPQKKYCARSMFFSKFGFQYSYTIQSSFGVYNGRRINQREMMKVGGDICQSVAQFLKLISCEKEKEKEKEKGLLNELLTLMRNESSPKSANPCDDSDSEEEDGKAASRRQFQDKVFKILTKSHKQDDLMQLTPKLKLRKEHPGLPQPEHQKEAEKEGHRLKRLNSLRYRHKTEQSLEYKRQRLSRDSSVFLPRLKQKQRVSSLRNNEDVSVLDCSFENMSLSQIKAKLLHLRNSKFGKRILIIH